MSYDLISARVRVGLASDDTSKDAELNGAMSASLSFAEKYCDRFFMFKEDTAELIHFTDSDAQLHRYPIESVESINSNGYPLAVEYHIEKNTGRLVFDSTVHSHTLLIAYSGGYSVLPPDLELALWRLFDGSWSVLTSTSSATNSTAGGPIKAISSSGARVEFDTSRGSGSGASGIPGGGLSDPFTLTILDLYALKTC